MRGKLFSVNVIINFRCVLYRIVAVINDGDVRPIGFAATVVNGCDRTAVKRLGADALEPLWNYDRFKIIAALECITVDNLKRFGKHDGGYCGAIKYAGGKRGNIITESYGRKSFATAKCP